MTTSTILTIGDTPEQDFLMTNSPLDARLLALVDKLRDSILAKLNAGLVCQPQAPTDRSMDFGTRIP